jgi:hypothetical protein
MMKLETRIPAGFIGGLTALIPQVWLCLWLCVFSVCQEAWGRRRLVLAATECVLLVCARRWCALQPLQLAWSGWRTHACTHKLVLAQSAHAHTRTLRHTTIITRRWRA